MIIPLRPPRIENPSREEEAGDASRSIYYLSNLALPHLGPERALLHSDIELILHAVFRCSADECDAALRPDQKRIFKLISRTEALRRTLSLADAGALENEQVQAAQSCGRTLAEDVKAPHDVPPYNKAAMDGYAVRSQDIKHASPSNPIRLTIGGRLFPPDRPSTGNISEGQCAYTSTGAPLPEGSDAVIQVERTRLREGAIEVIRPVRKNENVAIKGEEAERGETLLKRGHTINAQSVGILIALNIQTVRVVRKPRVSVISVGDELVEAYQESQSRIPNDHAYIISELVRQLGGVPRILGVVPDDLQHIRTRIGNALGDADIVITIAGSSVGTKDFVPDVVESLGKIAFHGVAMTPGKVTGIGKANGKPVVMLPGFLMSALAGFCVFAVPLLNRLAGHSQDHGVPIIEAKMEKSAKSKHGLEHFQLLKLSRHGASYSATPVEVRLGGMTDLSRANGYTIIPKNRVLSEGDIVTAKLFAPYEFQRIETES